MMNKVWMYRNLHKKIWSIKAGSKGRVRHSPRFFMKQVEFRVQPAGRARARKEKRKNVHAFAVGYPVEATGEEISKLMENYGPPHRVTYTPFDPFSSFKATGPEIYDLVNKAEAVLADAEGNLWAWEPR